MTIHPEYELGETVYLRHGDEGLRGVVTRLIVYADGCVVYGVSWGDRRDHDHYAVELSRTPVYATAGD